MQEEKQEQKVNVCKRPFHAVGINGRGAVHTCCLAYLKNYSIGNAFEENLVDIWNGEKATSFREKILNGDYSQCDMETCIAYNPDTKENVLKTYYDEEGKVKLPQNMTMDWDLACNVACITCRDRIFKNDPERLKNLEKIEHNIITAFGNMKTFYSSGSGDPFASRYARNLIKRVAKEYPQVDFLIHTNGTLCTEKICDELGIKNRIRSAIFSIHAATEETYNKIVKYGNFKNVMKNLEWISELNKSGQLNGIDLAFVVHKLNYKEMPDFVRLAEKYNVRASFRHYRQWKCEYKYEDAAVFEPWHPEHKEFLEVMSDEIFKTSKNCYLDPLLKKFTLA